MGIPTNPDDYLYGPNCLTCWAPNKTPKDLYASFSGIMTGATWEDWMGAAPNEIFKLSSAVPCLWTAYHEPRDIRFGITAPSSGLSIEIDFAWFAFTATNAPPCDFHFVNALVDPGLDFYGGQAIVVQKEAGSSAPSLADIAALLNMDGRESRMSEVFPLDNTHLVAMFADLLESTRIRIKYDFT